MVELLTVACPVAALPSELLPCIFTHLASPPHLHAAALVCKIWYPFVQEILYSHVWVRPWQKGADWKLVRLLETLSNGGSLSKLVQRLEVRSYPPPQIITNLVSSQTLLTFLSLPNLTSLAFTRDHSLSNALISAISTSMPNLRELEINAHSIGCFDPRSLLKIKGRLQRLALVMPDRGTVGVLEEWIRGIYEHSLEADARYPGLHELTILSKPLEIYVDDETKLTLHGLQQYYVQLEEKEKNRKLNELLDSLEFNQVCIFVKSVQRATQLDKLLQDCNFPSICIHSGLTQDQRIERYRQFKAFEKRILVATDIFGRGIDVERVNIVINYDQTSDADSYLHRVGRAGRFGTRGLAITFVTSDADKEILEAIQSRFEVKVEGLPEVIEPSTYMTS